MNGSPFRSLPTDVQDYYTPSRKTTPHHCNADRKNYPSYGSQQVNLSTLNRNLFGEENQFRRSNGYDTVNAKLFR